MSDDPQGTLRIQDDDVPGVRVVEIGDHTAVREGETATFNLSLLSEPTSDVTVRLTPGAEIEFVDPVNPTTVTINQDVYQFATPIADNLALNLNSLVTGDTGFTMAFDVRMVQEPAGDVTVEFYDSHNPTVVLEQLVRFTQTGGNEITGSQPGNWGDRQQVIIKNLDLDSNGNLALMARIKDSLANNLVMILFFPSIALPQRSRNKPPKLPLVPIAGLNCKGLKLPPSMKGLLNRVCTMKVPSPMK